MTGRCLLAVICAVALAGRAQGESSDAGLGKRLMFGSDGVGFPEAFGLAIEGIESADFLTERQKEDIFYNNAARFLRMDRFQSGIGRLGASATTI